MAAIACDVDSPIHGNLFGDQILVNGDRVGIVDWDDFCLGDPLYDLGRLVAHLIFMFRRGVARPARGASDIATLLEAYARESGQNLEWPRLRWQIAVALLMRAKISALRPLPEGWVEDVKAALAEASKVLKNRSDWL